MAAENQGEDNCMASGIGREVRIRWIRCTPLLGKDGRVGVWMIVVFPVKSEEAKGMSGFAWGLNAPYESLPNSGSDRGKEWDGIVNHDVAADLDKGRHERSYR